MIAKAFAPIFFENCINGALLLPLPATLPSQVITGTRVRLVVSAGELALSWPGEQMKTPCALPEWAVMGESWMDFIAERARAAGGLEALRARGLALR